MLKCSLKKTPLSYLYFDNIFVEQVVFACMVAAVAAQVRYENEFYKKNPYRYSTYRPFVSVTTPTPFLPIPISSVAPVRVVPKVSEGYGAETVKFGNEINPDGSYTYL